MVERLLFVAGIHARLFLTRERLAGRLPTGSPEQLAIDRYWDQIRELPT